MRLKALNEIREDLSWQTRLSPGELEVITRITGPVSRTLGFRWPDGAVEDRAKSSHAPRVPA